MEQFFFFMLHAPCSMALTSSDQIKNQIESAENILILTKPKASDDAIAASWGFFHLLEGSGKKPVLLETNARKEKLKFLKIPGKMEVKLVGARDFVLSFNTTKNKIIDFRTEDKLDSFEF